MTVNVDLIITDTRQQELIELAEGGAPASAIRNAIRETVEATIPIVSIKKMTLTGGRADYFVSIQVGDRDVTPHKFSEEYKAAYHVALYDWLLNGGDEPGLMAFGPEDWPAVKMIEVMAVGEAAPLTRADLADALGCFWNAAIGAAHNQQEGMPFASIMAEGVAAVAQQLNEPPVGSTAEGLRKAIKWVQGRQDDYIREHGTTDPETGTVEFPGAGEEYVAELVEIVDGLQALVVEGRV